MHSRVHHRPDQCQTVRLPPAGLNHEPYEGRKDRKEHGSWTLYEKCRGRLGPFVILVIPVVPAGGQLAKNVTGVPTRTMLPSRRASQLVRRMQPWEPVLPISSGLGDPWMP